MNREGCLPEDEHIKRFGFRLITEVQLGRYNGRDIERFSSPDVLQLCFPETPGEQMLAFSISNFWVGRVL
ncbi:hypothetical protein K9M47_03455 [Candidatus Gracilibacteria bacterium]|nr:hypothetical protein [Candidatus Gracilibacteria bacterium]MCF7898653.1 hypothetical protein [Candidatus Paceibacterota bacterium]